MPRLRSRVRASSPAPKNRKREAPASLFRTWVGDPYGAVAKRLCTGLQIRLAQFDSGPRLHPPVHLMQPSPDAAGRRSGAVFFQLSCFAMNARIASVCQLTFSHGGRRDCASSSCAPAGELRWPDVRIHSAQRVARQDNAPARTH